MSWMSYYDEALVLTVFIQFEVGYWLQSVRSCQVSFSMIRLIIHTMWIIWYHYNGYELTRSQVST